MNRCGLQSSFSNNILAIILLIFLFNIARVSKNKVHLRTRELLLLLILIVLRYSSCGCMNCRNIEKQNKCTNRNRKSYESNGGCGRRKTKHPVEEDSCVQSCSDEFEVSSFQSDLAEEIIFE